MKEAMATDIIAIFGKTPLDLVVLNSLAIQLFSYFGGIEFPREFSTILDYSGLFWTVSEAVDLHPFWK